MGMNVAEQEFGICPIMTGKEMSTLEESDSLCMVMYLSQFHELLKDTAPPSGEYYALRLSFILTLCTSKQLKLFNFHTMLFEILF